MISALGSLIPNFKCGYRKDLIDAHMIHQYKFLLILGTKAMQKESVKNILSDFISI